MFDWQVEFAGTLRRLNVNLVLDMPWIFVAVSVVVVDAHYEFVEVSIGMENERLLAGLMRNYDRDPALLLGPFVGRAYPHRSARGQTGVRRDVVAADAPEKV